MKKIRTFIYAFLSAWFFLVPFAVKAADKPVPPKFMIGVWYQPQESFDKWKNRGINTLIGCDFNDHDKREAWKAEARKRGLFYVLKPVPGHPEYDANDPYLLAWSQPDEPDGVGGLTPEQVKNGYAAMKTANATIPVFLNFDGWKTQWRPPADYFEYAKGGDILGMDFYPINRGTPGNISQIGDFIDFIRKSGGGNKQVFACIETSDQNLRIQTWANDATWGPPPAPQMRGPVAAEVETEVRLAVAHGVFGIVYFPDRIGLNFENYDTTPDDVVAVITRLNAELNAPPPPLVLPAATQPTTQPAPPSVQFDLGGLKVIVNGVTYTLQRQ